MCKSSLLFGVIESREYDLDLGLDLNWILKEERIFRSGDMCVEGEWGD